MEPGEFDFIFVKAHLLCFLRAVLFKGNSTVLLSLKNAELMHSLGRGSCLGDTCYLDEI